MKHFATRKFARVFACPAWAVGICPLLVSDVQQVRNRYAAGHDLPARLGTFD